MYSNEAENTINERLTLQSQTISFRTKSIKPPLDGASCLAPLPSSGLHQAPRNLDDASRKC